MALNQKEKEEIRRLELSWFFTLDNEGKPILYKGKDSEPFKFNLEKVRGQMVEKITKKGYTVEFVSPRDANCVIRTYRNENAKYDGGEYRLLGAHCYVKQGMTDKWFAENNAGDLFELTYNEYLIKVWFFQDEYHCFKVDYFDTYVKLTKTCK